MVHTKYVHIKSTIVYVPRRNWDYPPTPHPQASVPPPPCFWGEGNTRWRERGWDLGESQFRRGAYTVVLFICTYFVMVHVLHKCRLYCRDAARGIHVDKWHLFSGGLNHQLQQLQNNSNFLPRPYGTFFNSISSSAHLSTLLERANVIWMIHII
jgi:hypothetical protein